MTDVPMSDADRQPGRASSQIDLYDDAVKSTVDDETLEGNNLGLGNYDANDRYQQMEGYKRGLFADRALGSNIRDRAVHETKRQFALEGHSHWIEAKADVYIVGGWNELTESERQDEWDDLTGDEDIELTRANWIERQGERVWGELDDEQRAESLRDFAGFESDWKPPQWRMMLTRHETSRSKGAHLLDNLFQRVSEVKGQAGKMARDRLKR